MPSESLVQAANVKWIADWRRMWFGRALSFEIGGPQTNTIPEGASPNVVWLEAGFAEPGGASSWSQLLRATPT